MTDLVLKRDDATDPQSFLLLLDQVAPVTIEGLTPSTQYRAGLIVWDDDTFTPLGQADTTPPGLVGASSNSIGTFIDILFDETLDIGFNTAPPDWTLTRNGAPLALVAASILQGSTARLTLQAPLAFGDTVTVSYTGTSLRDTAGNLVSPINDQPVTNTVPDPGSTDLTPPAISVSGYDDILKMLALEVDEPATFFAGTIAPGTQISFESLKAGIGGLYEAYSFPVQIGQQMVTLNIGTNTPNGPVDFVYAAEDASGNETAVFRQTITVDNAIGGQPVFVAAETVETGDSLTIPIPDGHNEDDLAILILQARENDILPSLITGWVQLGEYVGEGSGSSVVKVALYARQLTSGTEADLVLPEDAVTQNWNQLGAMIAVYRHSSGGFLDVEVFSAANSGTIEETFVSLPGGVPSAVGKIFMALADRSSGAIENSGDFVNADLANITTRATLFTTDGGNTSLKIADGECGSSLIAETTNTLTVAARWLGVQLLISERPE